MLLKVDFSQTPPLAQVLLNAGQQMPDAVDYFSCLARDGGAVLIGSDKDIVRHGSSVDRISLNALEPKPHGIDCAHQVGPHHVVFGTPNGLVVDRVQQTLHVQRIFEDKMHGARVNALHGLGDGFLVAVGEGCLAVRERGLWRTVTPPSPDAFSGVWCCSRNEVYLAGDVLWRWNGADQWTPLPLSGSSRARRGRVSGHCSCGRHRWRVSP